MFGIMLMSAVAQESAGPIPQHANPISKVSWKKNGVQVSSQFVTLTPLPNIPHTLTCLLSLFPYDEIDCNLPTLKEIRELYNPVTTLWHDALLT